MRIDLVNHHEYSILLLSNLKNSHPSPSPSTYKSKYYKREEEEDASQFFCQREEMKKCRERFIKINKFGPRRETVREKGGILLARQWGASLLLRVRNENEQWGGRSAGGIPRDGESFEDDGKKRRRKKRNAWQENGERARREGREKL